MHLRTNEGNKVNKYDKSKKNLGFQTEAAQQHLQGIFRNLYLG